MATNVRSQLTPTIAAVGGGRDLYSLPDGSAVFEKGPQAWINGGKGYHITVGAFSTPIVGGGNGTIIDLDQPEVVISVPSGGAIRPIRIKVQCNTPLLATDADESEILIAVDRTAAWAGDGTFTTETPTGMRTDVTSGSITSCGSAFTADMTATTGADPVLGIELDRSLITGDVQGTPATAVWTKNELLYEPVYSPLIVGPAAIYIYWGGTVATSGFAQCQWIEYSSDYSSYFGG